MSALDKVLDQVERVKQVGEQAWIASCPVAGHGKGQGDSNPSLSIAYRDEKVLLNCMSGCHVQDVVIAMGMDWPDLWDTPFCGQNGTTIASWTYAKPDGSPYFTVETAADRDREAVRTTGARS